MLSILLIVTSFYDFLSIQVYAQVQILFNGSVDLLDEFKQFLPDTSGNATAASSALFGKCRYLIF